MKDNRVVSAHIYYPVKNKMVWIICRRQIPSCSFRTIQTRNFTSQKDCEKIVIKHIQNNLSGDYCQQDPLEIMFLTLLLRAYQFNGLLTFSSCHIEVSSDIMKWKTTLWRYRYNCPRLCLSSISQSYLNL